VEVFTISFVVLSSSTFFSTGVGLWTTGTILFI